MKPCTDSAIVTAAAYRTWQSSTSSEQVMLITNMQVTSSKHTQTPFPEDGTNIVANDRFSSNIDIYRKVRKVERSYVWAY